MFKLTSEACERAAQICDQASHYSLLGALAASFAGLILFLIDNSLIDEKPWFFIAGIVAASVITALIYGQREYRRQQSGISSGS